MFAGGMMSRSSVVMVCVLSVFLVACGRQEYSPPKLTGAIRGMSDRWKATRSFSEFPALSDLVKANVSPEFVKDVLGEPLEIGSHGGKKSWLYVRGSETQANEFDWWLTFNSDGATAGWLAQAQPEN